MASVMFLELSDMAESLTFFMFLNVSKAYPNHPIKNDNPLILLLSSYSIFSPPLHSTHSNMPCIVIYLFILNIVYSFFLLGYNLQKDFSSLLDLEHINSAYNIANTQYIFLNDWMIFLNEWINCSKVTSQRQSQGPILVVRSWRLSSFLISQFHFLSKPVWDTVDVACTKAKEIGSDIYYSVRHHQMDLLIIHKISKIY